VKSLYDSPADEISFYVVSDFVENALASNLLTESLTLELKKQRSGTIVVDAVAAMANADGGLVLVGIADAGDLVDRFVGITQAQHMGLADQLRSLLGGQIPELIPVRIPDSDLLILVIRVEADEFEHPVVVGGRVLVRAPGQSVPADRDRIVALSRPPTASTDTWINGQGAALPNDPMRFDLTEEEGPDLSIRTMARLELPRRAQHFPWLSTPGTMALLDTLNKSVVPQDVWLGSATPERRPTWRIFQARSGYVRAQALQADQLGSPQRSNCGGGVFLSRGSRDLSILLELSVANGDAERPVVMGLEQLVEGLLAVVLTATSALEAVAVALGCGEPTRLTSISGWLLPGDGRTMSQVLPLEEFGRHGQSESSIGVFPALRPRSKDPQDLDQLVRAWITAALLDDARYGFEEALAAVPNPWWMPPE
jgi:hypothetical protein